MNTYEDFRSVVRKERENLTHLSDFWNSKVNCDRSFSKESQGRIRATVGKTRLLLAEKFKQFETLIDQSENNTSEKEISINDLQGFWDLVLIQVNEIKDIFKELDEQKGGRVGLMGGRQRALRPRSDQDLIRKSFSFQLRSRELDMKDVKYDGISRKNLEREKTRSEIREKTTFSHSKI